METGAGTVGAWGTVAREMVVAKARNSAVSGMRKREGLRPRGCWVSGSFYREDGGGLVLRTGLLGWLFELRYAECRQSSRSERPLAINIPRAGLGRGFHWSEGKRCPTLGKGYQRRWEVGR